ncbi:response regulator [Candidatus Oscillochloris fontis]|uniref:response regulator n=1 Tax=Candidatus Oscillochloris fontis TaxID=2496868 RepID=UPI00101D8EE1|nr:response regulator [Candidatus Oscillochloris fontis]
MSDRQPTILVIEDELQIRRFLRSPLYEHGYHMIEASTGDQGVQQAAQLQPDGIILDLGLPDMDGLEVLRRIRSWSSVPIVILTARGHEQEKIALLDAGADDYLTKPFGIGELLARIRAALRRTSSMLAEQAPIIEFGDIKLDMVHRQVWRTNTQIHLTPIEYNLLVVLVRNLGRVVTQRQLLQEVWGPEYIDSPHYLRIYMQHLRHKLEADPTRPRFLLTELGVGYRLRDED